MQGCQAFIVSIVHLYVAVEQEAHHVQVSMCGCMMQGSPTIWIFHDKVLVCTTVQQQSDNLNTPRLNSQKHGFWPTHPKTSLVFCALPSSNRATSKWPPWAAQSKAVIEPSQVSICIFLSAPASSIKCTSSKLPCSAAKCKAVAPSGRAASLSAPASSSNFTTSRWLWKAAECTAVSLFVACMWCTSAMASSKRFTHSTWPSFAAMYNAASPSSWQVFGSWGPWSKLSSSSQWFPQHASINLWSSCWADVLMSRITSCKSMGGVKISWSFTWEPSWNRRCLNLDCPIRSARHRLSAKHVVAPCFSAIAEISSSSNSARMFEDKELLIRNMMRLAVKQAEGGEQVVKASKDNVRCKISHHNIS